MSVLDLLFLIAMIAFFIKGVLSFRKVWFYISSTKSRVIEPSILEFASAFYLTVAIAMIVLGIPLAFLFEYLSSVKILGN